MKIIEVIKYLRDKYDIKTFVETGTFMGVNAELHSKNFKRVETCEIKKDYFWKTYDRLRNIDNVIIVNESSPDFLNKFSDSQQYIFYLDAHFYDPNMPKGEGKFTVLRELKAMKKFKNSVIIIHDFDNNLGHITYDGIRLDMDLLRSSLRKINKNFYFYTNRLESCKPVKRTIKDIKKAGLNVDAETLDNLEYMWSKPRLTYRGVLYCLPTKLNESELKLLGLREWN